MWRDSPTVRSVLYLAQFASSLLFVVLYIWSTYSPPPPWTVRWNLDLALCFFFGFDYCWRLAVCTDHHQKTLAVYLMLVMIPHTHVGGCWLAECSAIASRAIAIFHLGGGEQATSHALSMERV